MHGGVIATLVDSVFVPAIGAAYPERRRYSTVDLSVQYLGAVTSEDLLAEGWITKRGRSIVFCAALAARGVTTPRGGASSRR